MGWLRRRQIREQLRMSYMTTMALAMLEGHATVRHYVANDEINSDPIPSGVSPEIDEIREMKSLVRMIESNADIEDDMILGPAFMKKLYDIHKLTRLAYDALPISRHQSYNRSFTPRGGWQQRGL